MNFPVLQQPIILLQYFSINYESYLLPYETKPPSFEDGKALHSPSIQNESSVYLKFSINEKEILLSRRSTCETNIYSHPPDERILPSLYYFDNVYGTVAQGSVLD